MQENEGKYIFGVVKVGDKGQIVIPKEARTVYNIKPGDALLMLGDQKGMALLKTDIFQSVIDQTGCRVIDAFRPRGIEELHYRPGQHYHADRARKPYQRRVAHAQRAVLTDEVHVITLERIGNYRHQA